MLLVVKSPKFVHPDVEVWRRYIIAIFKVKISMSGHHELIPVRSLGDRALFVSLDRCLSVSSNNLPSISSNSIYLTVSLPDPVVVHCLSSRSFERPTALCQVHDGKEMVCPSVRPFTLADHLLTYCNHHEWSNGLMFHEYYFIPESFQGLWKKIRTQDSQVRISRVRD
uniref:KIB1-4 beta-propeller domain-containing protein n=1 Tax=Triticum urartu TaxID=4572 RepID=A0A8R7UP91_TRIUA